MKRIFFLLTLLVFSLTTFSQNNSIDKSFLNTDLPLEERVDILVDQLTLREKVNQLKNNAKAISRLDIPAYDWWNEALHGVARAGYATVFPQSITLASSFDKEIVYDVANIISDEARGKYHEFIRQGQHGIYQGLTFWSPNINIFRDPRWGRGHETYGEDPFLTGELASQFIKGLQGDDSTYFKTIATSKHFAVHSGPEPLRHGFDAKVGDVDMYETYLPAFRKTVKEAGVYSIMSAYNRVNGEPATASDFLFNTILRDKWGFDGYIVSDCGAVSDIWMHHKTVKTSEEATALSLKRGLDLNCGSNFKNIQSAINQGLLEEEVVDQAVKRLFLARFKLGMFDPLEGNPYADIPFSVVSADYHVSKAREAAQKSIVLLKNEESLLPLDAQKIKKIAVIGPNADNVEALIGNYHGTAKNPITVLEGIRKKVEPEVEVTYAQGSTLAQGIHRLTPIPSIYFETEDGQQGITGEYYTNQDFEGEPLFTRVDDQINFYWEQYSPHPEMKDDDYSIRWTGYLVPPVSGKYRIGSWCMPRFSIELEGEILFDNVMAYHHAFHRDKEVTLEAGKKYKVVFDYINYNGEGDVKMLWALPEGDLLNEAVSAAESSDAVVLVLGLSQRLEGEEMEIEVEGFAGGDRTNIQLPQEQVELMKAVEATGKPVILVMMTGSAIAINWADENIESILYAGYTGEQGGNAVADVLFGQYNPAGRLPVTYYKSVDQLPDFADYSMKGRTYRYFEGEPLYPFGYGLSYSEFGYSDLALPKRINAGDPITVKVTVTNKGSLAGDEVVQLYLTDEKGSTSRPLKQLEGFDRVYLKAGESKELSFELDPRQLSMINAKGNRVIEPGYFTIAVGGQQPGLMESLKASTTETISSKVRVRGTYSFKD